MVALAEVPALVSDLDGEETANSKAAELQLGAELETARKLVEVLTRGALEKDDNSPLDEFLTQMVEVVSLSSPTYGKTLERQIDAFRKHPMDPFAVIFEAARKASVWFYEREGHGVGDQPIRCELSLGPGRGDGMLPTGPQVNGALDSRSSGTLVVWLKLTSASFWDAEICALSYTIIHELVVHGFASANNRTSVERFAEGWMDFIAHQLHSELSQNRLPGLQSPLSREFPPNQQEYFATLIHAARAEAQELVKKGRLAAMGARNALLAQFGGDTNRARNALWAFSAALNRSAVKPGRRSEACEAIGRAAASRDEVRLQRWFSAVEAIERASSAELKVKASAEFAEDPSLWLDE
jgi:hypothetical protein